MSTAIRPSLSIFAALFLAGCGNPGSSAVSADQMRAEAASQAADECSANPQKILVCHVPPGNPDNWHTICISENAVQTHQDHHGDAIGATCEEIEDPGLPGDDDDAGDDDDTTDPDGTTPPRGENGDPDD